MDRRKIEGLKEMRKISWMEWRKMYGMEEKVLEGNEKVELKIGLRMINISLSKWRDMVEMIDEVIVEIFIVEGENEIDESKIIGIEEERNLKKERKRGIEGRKNIEILLRKRLIGKMSRNKIRRILEKGIVGKLDKVRNIIVIEKKIGRNKKRIVIEILRREIGNFS